MEDNFKGPIMEDNFKEKQIEMYVCVYINLTQLSGLLCILNTCLKMFMTKGIGTVFCTYFFFKV